MNEQYLRLLGSNIRNSRKQRGLTQEDVADKASINASYYGRIERGEINLTIETLQAITHAMNIPIPELFTPELDTASVRKLQKEVGLLASKLDSNRLRIVRDLIYNLTMPRKG